jgi:hypothetical protein
VAALHQQNLVAADAEMAIGQRLIVRRRQIDA